MRRAPALTASLAAAALLLSACTASDDTDASAQADPTPGVEDAAGEPADAMTTDAMTTDEDPALDAAPDETTPGDSAAGDSAGDAAGDEAVAAPVPPPLDFSSATVDGGTFDGATIAGTDAVLYFWAPWCTICRREAPALPGLADEFTGQATFYGVAGLSPDVAAMQAFVADTGTGGLTHIADTEGTIYAGFGITSQTTFAFVDDSGDIEVVRGPLSEDEIRQRTQALVET